MNMGQSKYASPGSEAERPGDTPSYYDFGDVLIPAELKVDRDASFVYHTPGNTTGVLTLKGRVEFDSLIAFFNANMAKDKWTQISFFKSPRTIMLYKKDNRWCVIRIEEYEFSTGVEIWVAPTTATNVDGLIK